MDAETTVTNDPDTGHASAAPGVSLPDLLAGVLAFPDASGVEWSARLLPARETPARAAGEGWGIAEGPRHRIEVSPGVVAVRSTDPARAERTANREADRVQLAAPGRVDGPNCGWVERDAAMVRACSHDSCAETVAPIPAPEPDNPRRRVVTGWSAKSRARMVERLGTLDYSPLVGSGRAPAMLTLTYPGDWLAVAPTAAASVDHVKALRKRFRRAWGVPLVGIWKREFHRRGAPHWHIHAVPPHGTRSGLAFRDWLSETWADIVGADWCGRRCWEVRACCERGRHVLAGTGIDYAEGLRAKDPKRLAVYFSKHGAFSAKDYQNDAPGAWLHRDGCDGGDCAGCASVGRFWGYWGLERATTRVEVSADDAVAAMRFLRRYSHHAGFWVTREVWRKEHRPHVDTTTGEVSDRWRWRRRRVKVWSSRLTGGQRSGFLMVNDGTAVAGLLARHLSQRHDPRPARKSGAGPRGPLP